jgi:hypothetical protein
LLINQSRQPSLGEGRKLRQGQEHPLLQPQLLDPRLCQPHGVVELGKRMLQSPFGSWVSFYHLVQVVGPRKVNQYSLISQRQVFNIPDFREPIVLLSMITQHDYIVSLHHLLQIMSDSHVIPPINTLFLPRRSFRNSFCFEDSRLFLLEVLDSESDSGERKHEMVHSRLLFESDVYPTSKARLGWSLQGHSFPVLTFLVGSQVMPGLNRVHKTHIIQIWVHFEEVLPQILRSFQVLQISGDIIARNKFLAFLSVALIFEDHDFIDFEYRCDSGYLADEISPEGTGLGDFQDGVWEANSEMPYFGRSPLLRFFLFRNNVFLYIFFQLLMIFYSKFFFLFLFLLRFGYFFGFVILHSFRFIVFLDDCYLAFLCQHLPNIISLNFDTETIIN